MNQKKNGERFIVTSRNINELISKPLPKIETQVKYLLEWLCARLGADRFGDVELQQDLVENLTGIVGAINPDRVGKLVGYAAQKGLIERREGSKVAVTPEGWETVNSASEEDAGAAWKAQELGMRSGLLPAQSSREKPEWADRIDDETVRRVLDEVYTALDHDLTILAANGARTLLDLAMSKQVGDPKGGFRGKVEAMARAGRIGGEEKQDILAMVDVGNAAAHRGYIPPKDTLEKVMDATESLLHREFILPKDAEAVRKETPPR